LPKIGEFSATHMRWCCIRHTNIWAHHLAVSTWCGETMARFYVLEDNLRISTGVSYMLGKTAT